MSRRVLLVVHPSRALSLAGARSMAHRLSSGGVHITTLHDEATYLRLPYADTVPAETAAQGCELVVVLGGDGTLLRAAELARPWGAAILGVNVGRVGFLAETEPEELDDTAVRILDGGYVVEDRMTLETVVFPPDSGAVTGWALNEAVLERGEPARMIEVTVKVDERPLSVWGCDGVVCATPTGSTAYAFSAGGPVVWPEVAALLVVPSNAHALFARAMVISPRSRVTIDVHPGSVSAVLSHDGRRNVPVPPGTTIEIRRSDVPVRVARTHPGPFTDRLVAKFDLPVMGWRAQPAE